MNDVKTPDEIICSGCRQHMAASMLSCPSCHKLVYADRLKQISENAGKRESAGDIAGALSEWREALALLPESTKQYTAIFTKVENFSRQIDSNPSLKKAKVQEESSSEPGKSMGKKLGGLGAIGLLIWKFKFLVVLIATKGKLLLLGLTKANTIFSMLASFGLYWSIWGWKFAMGLVVSIYIHEMGHVAALRKFGIHATAPFFIPGVGALVRLKQNPATPLENARVGLAGPIWGFGASVLSLIIYLITNNAIFAAIASVGAWINLFNLLPIMPLDGGRGFQALTRNQRWLAVSAIGIAWFLTGEGLLMLLLIAGIIFAFSKTSNSRPDPVALFQYIGLLAALTVLSRIPVPS
jgi:Zn-dependent protease